MTLRSAGRLGAWVAALCAATAAPAAAQLRPLDPIPWDAVGVDGAAARIGVGAHGDARATLAGTRGRLLELGTILGTWSSGRVTLEVGGTALRVFTDDSVYAVPVEGARSSTGERRIDTGEHRLGTIVRLTPPGGSADAVLRFGTILPTTQNEAGLGRDQTDFFGTVGGRLRRGPYEITGEAGVGILGTRRSRPEQVDALLYAGAVGWSGTRSAARLEVMGQHDTRRAAELRGLEDLSELRLSAQAGRARWVRTTLVRGLTFASPALGMSVEVGLSRRRRP